MVRLTPGSSLQLELYQLHKSVGITVLALTSSVWCGVCSIRRRHCRRT